MPKDAQQQVLYSVCEYTQQYYQDNEHLNKHDYATVFITEPILFTSISPQVHFESGFPSIS